MGLLRCVFSGDVLAADSNYPRRIIDCVWIELSGSMKLVPASSAVENKRFAYDVPTDLKLKELSIDSASLGERFLDLMRRLAETMDEERVEQLWRNAPGLLRHVLANYHEGVQVYEGESRDPEGGLVICIFGDDGITPKVVLPRRAVPRTDEV